MKRLIKISICVTLLLTLFLCGCGSQIAGASKTETKYAVLTDSNKKVYLTEQNPEIAKVEDVAKAFAKTQKSRDFNTVKGDEEYKFYCKSMLDLLNSKNDIQETVKYYQDNKIVANVTGSEIKSVLFNKDQTKCDVVINVLAKETIATNAKLKNGGNTEQELSMTLIKENDLWKVGGYQWGTLTVK